MELVVAKGLALALLGLVSLLFGFLPLTMRKWIDTSPEAGRKKSWKNTLVSLLLCFGGGVIMATSLVHILPEVIETLESTSFEFEAAPVAGVVFSAGFFLISAIDLMVHSLCDSHVETPRQNDIHRAFSIHSHSCEAGVRDMQVESSQENLTSGGGGGDQRRSFSTGPGAQQHSGYQTFQRDHAESSEAGAPQDGYLHLRSAGSGVRELLTILALSCHSIFEGLAIGLENDVDAVWTLFAAVGTHKFVIAFCVGLELLTSKSSIKRFCSYIIVFSLVSPLGVGIGIGISSTSFSGSDGYQLFVAILQGLAGGTLLYVVVYEVLQREKGKTVSKLAQMMFVLVGFTTLSCITIFTSHGHGHGHDEHEEGSTLAPDFNS